jgi:hypothetical protein
VRPGPGEPPAGPRWVEPIGALAARVLAAAGDPGGRPRVVAVDGRGAGGKTTIAERLRAAVPRASVVHTDDVAWHESFFGWDGLMAGGVLEPLRRGEAVAFRPPAWEARGRAGAVEVPAGQQLVLVEGVGAGRRKLAALLDAVVWVQSDFDEAERRGLVRDGGEGHRAFWDEWMAEEVPFLEADRPWERAHVVVCGTPSLPHDAATEVVVAAAPTVDRGRGTTTIDRGSPPAS